MLEDEILQNIKIHHYHSGDMERDGTSMQNTTSRHCYVSRYIALTLYAASGIVLCIFLLNIINTNILRMKIETAFVSTDHENKTVTAYLSMRERSHIKDKNAVKIYLPFLRKSYVGKIARITDMNRINGFVVTNNAQYSQQDIDTNQYKVIISMQNSDQTIFNKDAILGKPAILYFARKVVLLKTDMKEGAFNEN